MPRLIGIDVGARALKVSVIHATGRKVEFEGRHIVEVPQTGMAVPTMASRVTALAELVNRHPEWQHPSNTVAVAWSAAAVRRIALPFADRAQIERALPFAVEAEVPFDLEDMVMGWRPHEGRRGQEVLTVLAERDAVKELVGGLAGIKVDPKYVFHDADLLAALAPTGTVAVLDVGHGHSALAVVRHGVAEVCRSIDVGGHHVIRAVAKALDVPYSEAEWQVVGGNPLDPDDEGSGWDLLPAAARLAADEVMGLLLAEVRSTLVGAEDDLGLDITELRLVGGGSRLGPLGAYLASDLGIPVVRPPSALGGAVSPVYALADTLAARVSGKTKGVEVDLRSGDLAYRGGVDVLRATVLYGGGGFVAFMLAALVVFGVRYRALDGELDEVEARIRDTVVAAIPSMDPSMVRDSTIATSILRQEMDDAKVRAQVLGSSSGVPPTVALLADLTKAFPPPDKITVDVTELTITPTAVTFTAETDSYASADAVEASLQASERFKSAAKGQERQSRERVSFPVTIPLGDGGAPTEEEG
jgi:general secretion pathway protein L